MTVQRMFTLLAMAALLALAGCEGSFSVSTAKLSEPKLASAVDAKTKQPTKLLDKVTPSTGAIFATVKFSHAPAGTKVKTVFFLDSGQKRKIAEEELGVEGTAWVSVKLSPPASGWPAGKYEVVFFLNGKQAEQMSFTVEAKAAAPPSTAQPAQAPPAAQPAAPPAAPPAAAPPTPPAAAPPAAPNATGSSLKWMGDNKYGFAFRAPADWRQRTTKSGAYFINGPAGSRAEHVNIIIQMIDKSPNGTPLMGEMKNLLQQYAKLPTGKILKKGEVKVAGKTSPFFLASYQAKGPNGQPTEYAHTQLGLEHNNFILLISYSAPPDIYKEFLPVFQGMVDTFKYRD